MYQLPNDLNLIEPTLLNQISDEQGRLYAQIDKVKTNQIRNIFAAINLVRTEFRNKKNFTQDIERNLIMIKPMLAYAKGRQPTLKNFQEFMFKAVDSVINSKEKKRALENFFLLVESIVAYHKFYGGKEK